MNRRDFVALGGYAGLSAALPGSACAQAPYPTHPIKLIVPFSPGGVEIGRAHV